MKIKTKKVIAGLNQIPFLKTRSIPMVAKRNLILLFAILDRIVDSCCEHWFLIDFVYQFIDLLVFDFDLLVFDFELLTQSI